MLRFRLKSLILCSQIFCSIVGCSSLYMESCSENSYASLRDRIQSIQMLILSNVWDGVTFLISNLNGQLLLNDFREANCFTSGCSG